jgi:hydroxymethylpyrimidine/phosphomethylpyrimidine kinase
MHQHAAILDIAYSETPRDHNFGCTLTALITSQLQQLAVDQLVIVFDACHEAQSFLQMLKRENPRPTLRADYSHWCAW